MVMNLLNPENSLPGRTETMPGIGIHFVNQRALMPPYPEQLQQLMFGMGCFWGAEKQFWQLAGVYVTAVGYAAGVTPNPSYEEVCSGRTGHNEVVRVIFDPQVISRRALLSEFWQAHEPTQGMRQGNDRGTQYRSGIYVASAQQLDEAESSREIYQRALSTSGLGTITTEIMMAPEFYYAENYHQQYLAKNPAGYCGLGGTGIFFPE
ncbi:Peptide-methionine (S)-S-oxide reductase MsrA [hydrothermal vent metagenome]|uniref:peptide-methionine (S)-S-oxide reductase n=1 Tax=hydrothermal vent metagenome TaxID=652676 RepID=A0A3B1B0U7_9ZZZZ